jgi:hypothetical protein
MRRLLLLTMALFVLDALPSNSRAADRPPNVLFIAVENGTTSRATRGLRRSSVSTLDGCCRERQRLPPEAPLDS